jgi:SAM-dependent methyltransferase
MATWLKRSLSAVARLRDDSSDLTMSNRSNYKATWQELSKSVDDAKRFVAGTEDEKHFEVTGLHTVDILSRFVGIKPTDTVLEIGCGVGRVGKVLAPRCKEWIGTDISGNMLEHARRRLEGLGNVRFVELSGQALKEIRDASVDLVYCTVVFMHLFEWDRYRYVQDAHRVLRPGGRGFFDNVDIASGHGWKVFTDAVVLDPAKRPAHLAMTSSGDELSTYARRAGFQDVQIHRWDDAWVGVVGTKA